MSQSTSALTNITPGARASDVGMLQFMVQSALAGVRTAIPVKVISVTNTGGLEPIGTLSVQPLVSAVDGGGVVWEHTQIYNCPYMRIQGGANAVILDPAPGDIGLGIVCDRDITAVQQSLQPSAPGSNRKHDLSDMVYLMTIISNTTPTQYVQFNASGVTVTTPQNFNLNVGGNISMQAAGDININGQNINNAATQSISQTASGAFTINASGLTHNGTNVGATHTHGGVAPGSNHTLTPG